MIYSQFINFIPGTDNQLYALCPFHKETKPSFTVNTETKEWYCHGCGEGGSEKEFIAKYYDVDPVVAKYAVDYWYSRGTWPFPNQDYIDKMHQALLERPSEISVLNSFGITGEAIEKYQLGWEDMRIVFPVFSRTGQCTNLRKYLPPHRRTENSTNVKMVCIKGLGKGEPKFYPYGAFEQNPIYVMEGEKDCIAARSQGLNAVTGTGGSTLPVAEMLMFQGKDVIIVTDTDATGNKIAKNYFFLLQLVAKTVKRAILPAKDFVEYFQQTGKFDIDSYIDETGLTLFDTASVKDAQEVSLLRSESIENLDTWVELKNMTIVGVEPQTYSVPIKVECLCENPKCDKLCPLAPSALTCTGPLLEIPPRFMVSFIDSADSAQDKYVQQKFRCKHVKAKSKEFINCQKIIFQESASFVDGLEEGSFEHRYGIYMYPDNRLTATMKYDLVTCRVTDPRSQQAIYVISDATPVVANKSVLNMDVVEEFRTTAEKASTAKELLQIHYNEWMDVLGIEGRLDLFGSMLLTYCSVTEIPWQGGIVKGWLDTICMGDTRTGKSQMAQRFVKVLGMGGYINGENARRTGVIGGIQQFGGSWVITWGAIPLNDRGLLIIDEASGLEIEDVKDLSSTRSSGAVTINKVVKGEARARTRLLWLSNPRSGTNLQDFYWKGYGAFQEFIPIVEDQARFDILISAAREDIDLLKGLGEADNIAVEKWRNLVALAWALPVENIRMSQEFKQEVRNAAAKLNTELGGGPLVVGVAVHEKLLRLACAFAILCGSITSSGTLELVSSHLSYSVEFISMCLNKGTVGYGDYVRELRRAREARTKNVEYVRSLITLHPAIRSILTARTFRGHQFCEILGIDRSDAAKILSDLITRGLVTVGAHATYKTDGLLIEIARQMEA